MGPAGKFDNGEGKWDIEKKQDWWVVGLEFNNALGITSIKDWEVVVKNLDGTVTVESGRAGKFWTSIDLIGEQAPYILHLTVGDPDSGRALQYERIERPDDSGVPGTKY